jgi:hypothetical protein
MARKRQPQPMEFYARLAQDIAPWVRKAKFKLAIAHCEAALASLPPTEYHKAAGRSWLPQTDKAARWLAGFYRRALKELQVSAIYCEMNSFEINADEWYVDGFAYDFFGEPADPGWLCGWQKSTGERERLVLRGMDDLQALFARDYAGAPPADMRPSSEVVMHLLVLRMQELVHAAAQQARHSRGLPEDVPVLAAVHDSDLICFSYGRVKPPITRKGPARPKHSPSPRSDGRLAVYRLSGGWDEFNNSLPWDTLECVREDEDDKVIDSLDKAKSSSRSWKPPKLTLHRRKWRADLIELWPHSYWAANEKAMQALSPLLGKTVEFLPARCAAIRKLWLLHPLEHIDLAAGAMHNGAKGHNMTVIRQCDFNLNDLVGKHFFGVKQALGSAARQGGHCFGANYVSEEFKQTFAKHRLQGVVFEEVFSYGAGKRRVPVKHSQSWNALATKRRMS